MATTNIGPTSPWPTIVESHADKQEDEHGEVEGENWEILSGSESRPGELSLSLARKNRALKHCESSPNFGSIYFEDEEESFLEIDPDMKSVSTTMTDMSHVLVETPSLASASSPVGGGMVKVHRVPSFKDAILLNAQEIQKEQHEEKKRKEQDFLDSMKKTKLRMNKPKIVVKEFKRCSMSTPDLSSLARVDEHDNEEVWGETDASDFYARKSMGASSRRNGLKLRPDEAKRKAFIMHKKNAQRVQGRR